MRRLANPILFSTKFGVPEKALKKAALLDPILNCDTKLFVDPLLISTSSNSLVRTKGRQLLTERFEQIFRLIAASQIEGDKAWGTAAKLLALEERPETGLGYGGSGTSGSSRPDEIRQQVLRTTKEVISLGERDPQIISLMGLFEEGVGPDTISDLTTNTIFPALIELTEKFCREQKIPTRPFHDYGGRKLPENPLRVGCPIVLVPQDILRELPLAADWGDLGRVIEEIEGIREAFNRFVGNIGEATIVERKKALRKAAFESLSNFRALFEAMLDSSDHYDPNADILNFYAFRKVLAQTQPPLPGRSSHRKITGRQN